MSRLKTMNKEKNLLCEICRKTFSIKEIENNKCPYCDIELDMIDHINELNPRKEKEST